MVLMDLSILTSFLLLVQWICLESLLSIPCHALKKGLHLEDNNFLLSGDTLRLIFTDLLER